MARKQQSRRKHATATDALVDEGLRLYRSGEAVRALDVARRAAAAGPRNARALGLLAICAEHTAFYKESLDASSRALKIRPGDSLLYTVRARALRMVGEAENALETFDRAIAADPRNETAVAAKSQLLLALNRPDEAGALLDSFGDDTGASHQIALARARLANRSRNYDHGIRVLREKLEQDDVFPAARADLLGLLAELLDRAGQFGEAFRTMTESHSIKGSRFDKGAHRRAIDRLLKEASPERFEKSRVNEVPDGAPVPVFVLGFPRSGTTLVERMLGAHPRVHAAGELDTLCHLIAALQQPLGVRYPQLFQSGSLFSSTVLSGVARRYRAALPSIEPPADRVTDKMPANVLGLHVLAAAMPDAQVVLCERDLRDTAISCYFQPFGSLIEWTRDLEHIARYFEDVTRALDHFTGTLGINVIRVPYETLVLETEPTLRTLLAALDLDWHGECLRPHEQAGDARTRSAEQVTEPINARSIGRWKNYESPLSPFLERIGSLGS